MGDDPLGILAPPKKRLALAPDPLGLLRPITAQRDDTSVGHTHTGTDEPGVLARTGHAITDIGKTLLHDPLKLLTAPLESAADALLTPVEGSTASGVGGRGGRATLPQGTVVTKKNTPGAINDERRKQATIETLVNVGAGLGSGKLALKLAPKIGGVASRVVGRTTANAMAGAVTNPTDPAVGALSNMVVGEATHRTAKLIPPHVGIEMSRAPNAAWDVLTEDGNLVRRFKSDATLAAWQSKHGYRPDPARMGLFARGDVPIGTPETGAPSGIFATALEAARREKARQAGVEYRHSGFGIVPEAAKKIKTTYRKLVTNPYAEIEGTHPELNEALHIAGASDNAATHLSTRGVDWVLEGLDKDQQRKFGQQLVLDNLKEEASRKATSDPEAAQNFAVHAAALEKEMGAPVSDERWFKDALQRHQHYIGSTMNPAATLAGVAPKSFRNPSSAYVRLISEDRLTNRDIRRALDAQDITNPDKLKPRGKILRSLIGEKPEIERLLVPGARDLKVGPLNPKIPSTRTDKPILKRGASQSGSSRTAQGTAREYITDYRRLVGEDAADKIRRAAENNVYAELSKVGRLLDPKEEPAIGKQAVERKVLGADGTPTIQRFEVEPAVAKAIRTYEGRRGITDETGFRKLSSFATRAQIAGMPVEATSHANTLSSIVGSIPGEKDMAGKIIASIPLVGGKAAAIREMRAIDFSDPEIRALETRLAQTGALRIQHHPKGLINTSSNWLFGPQGVDIRGRLVLARKYLAENPQATDGKLREFITSKLGNYNRETSGAAVNALQSGGISAFSRFQAARIPSSVRSTFGASGLPLSTKNVAGTLWRGPVGGVVGLELANRLLSGHSTEDNERGHQYDIQLPWTVGPHKRPVYLPLSTLNPVLATGLRATGLRDLIPRSGSPNAGGRVADASRDVVNTGLGVLSPMVRGLSVAAFGRTPYVQSDGSMLRVTNSRFDKGSEIKSRLLSALVGANPATSAFAGQGGDVGGSTLADALAQDDRVLGGPKSIAARAGAFILPRVATVGVGGRDNEQSAEARDRREYQAAMQDYKSQLRRAPGPKDQAKIIATAVADAQSDGRFDPGKVSAELEKYLRTPSDKRDATSQRSTQRFTVSHEAQR